MPPRLIDADLELERKFACSRAADLDAAAEMFQSLSVDIRLTNRYTSALHYYDTADLDLRQSGVILRTLDANPPHYSSRVQIKSAQSGDNGLMRRTEHNLAVSADGLQLQDLKGHAALAFLQAARKKPYQHWFTTLTDRREIRAMFAINGKAVMIECALDRFRYYRPGETAAFHRGCELEIELKQKYSDPSLTAAEAEAVLAAVGQMLRAAVPGLKPTSSSRADRGFAALARKAGDSRCVATKKPAP